MENKLSSPKLHHWSVGFFLAYRSLTRGNLGTIVMTIMMLALIFINLIFLTSIINGVTVTTNTQIIDTTTGEILVETGSDDSSISNSAQAEQDLGLIPGVKQLSARTNFSAELDFESKQGSYRGIAIQPDREAVVTTVAQQLTAGRWLTPDDTNAVVLGSQVAGKPNGELYAYSLKGVQVGDVVTMKYTTGLKKDYTVVGIFNSDFVQSDNRFFISQHEYDILFPQLKNHSSEFALRLLPNTDLASTVQAIHQLNISDNIRTWEDTAGIAASFTKSFQIVNYVVSFVAIIVAGITIFIVMYVDVINRRKQIGILRAIGISELAIAISYILRALFYASIGVVLGFIVFKVLLIPVFTKTPLHLPIGNVSLAIENSVLYVRAWSIIIVSFLGAYIPIARTLRMHIIDAIWGE